MDSLTSIIEHPQWHMWFSLAVVGLAIFFYAREKWSLEVTSIATIVVLLVGFSLIPSGSFNPAALLLGFANPALVAVMSLLVVGQAVVRTGALNDVAGLIIKHCGNSRWLALLVILVTVMVVSGVLNNTPVVVIFIPILASVARELGASVSGVMIPLSYAAILGGMTTLIGSSTNLLVAGEMVAMGMEPIGFFDFIVPGLYLAAIGLVYIMFVAPRILPDRASMVADLMGEDGRQFVTQLDVTSGSKLLGIALNGAEIEELPDVTIKMIQRGEHAFLPPYDGDISLQAGDTMVVSTTRSAFTDIMAKHPELVLAQFPELMNEDLAEDGEVAPAEGLSMAEIIVAPASRMIGMNLEQIGFRYHHHCIVMGIQRGQKMIRARMTEMRLQAGDVLLVMGSHDDILALKDSKDILLMEWSTEELPNKTYAYRAAAIFMGVVGLAAFDILPIYISALMGAFATIATGCINIRQALRSMDSQIIFIVGAAMAMSTALQHTGGASFIANNIVSALHGLEPVWVMSALFIFMAMFTNFLSNNASALLFTPIAIQTAALLSVDPKMFVYAVIFACNCSFATPIGYQTNLLVMGPGHYKFVDYMRAGIPLVLILWLGYTSFAMMYF